MEFNFDEVFKNHAETVIEEKNKEIVSYQKRADEYNDEYMTAFLANMATSISLDVTKRVLEDYHQFLMQKISESR